MKVRKYYEYLYKEDLEEQKIGDELLNGIAPALREEVFIDIYGELLKSKKIFNLNFSTNFLNSLALKMK